MYGEAVIPSAVRQCQRSLELERTAGRTPPVAVSWLKRSHGPAPLQLNPSWLCCKSEAPVAGGQCGLGKLPASEGP